MVRTSSALAVLAAAAVTLSLAGCGGAGSSTSAHSGSSQQAGATSIQSPTATLTATTPITPPPSVPVPAPGPLSHPLPPATAVNEADYEVPSFGAKGPAFNSPSLNLHCGILDFGSSSGYWGCEAEVHSWTFASAAPGDPCYNSEINCGHGIQKRFGGAVGVEKAGDIQYPGGDPTDYTTKVLAYGKSVSYDGVTCASESDGVTCIETSSGHGFFISKSANSIF